jgi:hypothetical protein
MTVRQARAIALATSSQTDRPRNKPPLIWSYASGVDGRAAVARPGAGPPQARRTQV